MPKNKLKQPRRWPPDKKLATTGYVKTLFDRIMSKKDCVVKRTSAGKPVFGV